METAKSVLTKEGISEEKAEKFEKAVSETVQEILDEHTETLQKQENYSEDYAKTQLTKSAALHCIDNYHITEETLEDYVDKIIKEQSTQYAKSGLKSICGEYSDLFPQLKIISAVLMDAKYKEYYNN